MNETGLQAFNNSLLQDEMLMQIVQVLDGGYPLGPAFLQGLSAVVEAAVLHENNYFDLLHAFHEPGASGLQAHVRNSPFIMELQDGGALQRFPEPASIDLRLEQLGLDECMLDFVLDLNLTAAGAAFTDIESEARYCALLTRMLDRHPVVFRQIDLTDGDDVPSVPGAAALVGDGATMKTLIFLEGQNHRLDAMVRLCQRLELHLYANVASVPHQIGMIDHQNGMARKLYQALESELGSTEQEFGLSGFTTVDVPALTRAVLKAARGNPLALAAEIVRLRDRHRSLRTFLTEYDERWTHAANRRERQRLQADFDHAWQTLVRFEKRPRDRLIYKIWDVLKKPTVALSALGDKLADSGRRWTVTGQVRGIHSFWADLLDAPVARESYALTASLGLGMAVDGVWKTHQEMAAAVERFVSAPRRLVAS